MAAIGRPQPLLKAAQIEAMPEEARVHALDSGVVRHNRSLGDAVGLQSIGVHLVRLRPGHASTVYHFHHQDEEWIYILSGRGLAEIGDEIIEIGAGDFMGFVAGSVSHLLRNPHQETLAYLVGGNRLPFDICDYPRLRKRRYRIDGKSEFVGWDLLEKAGALAKPRGG